MQKIAIAAAIAMMLAGPALAQQTVGDNSSAGDYSTGSIGSDSSDNVAVDADDNDGSQFGGDSATQANIGNDSDNNFQINMSFDDVAAGILASARNAAAIDGSINLNGANITISAQDVEANAQAKAEAATEATSTATSNAFSGSTFSATAIGALMSASIEVDESMVTDSATFTSTDLKFTGEDMNLDTATLSGTSFGVDLSVQGGGWSGLGGSELTSDLAEFSGNLATTESRVNPIGAMLVADNTAAINASVNLDAVYQAGNVFHAPSGGMIDLTNLNITTTAVGAINSGSIRLGSLLSPQ